MVNHKIVLKASAQRGHTLPCTFHGPKEVTWPNPNLSRRGKIIAGRRGEPRGQIGPQQGYIIVPERKEL